MARACESRKVMKAWVFDWRVMLQNGRGTVSGALVISCEGHVARARTGEFWEDSSDGIKWAVLMSQWVRVARDG